MLLTRSPLDIIVRRLQITPARLAYLRHAASVRPEPGSNSPLEKFEVHKPAACAEPTPEGCSAPTATGDVSTRYASPSEHCSVFKVLRVPFRQQFERHRASRGFSLHVKDPDGEVQYARHDATCQERFSRDFKSHSPPPEHPGALLKVCPARGLRKPLNPCRLGRPGQRHGASFTTRRLPTRITIPAWGVICSCGSSRRRSSR